MADDDQELVQLAFRSSEANAEFLCRADLEYPINATASQLRQYKYYGRVRWGFLFSLLIAWLAGLTAVFVIVILKEHCAEFTAPPWYQIQPVYMLDKFKFYWAPPYIEYEQSKEPYTTCEADLESKTYDMSFRNNCSGNDYGVIAKHHDYIDGTLGIRTIWIDSHNRKFNDDAGQNVLTLYKHMFEWETHEFTMAYSNIERLEGGAKSSGEATLFSTSEAEIMEKPFTSGNCPICVQYKVGTIKRSIIDMSAPLTGNMTATNSLLDLAIKNNNSQSEPFVCTVDSRDSGYCSTSADVSISAKCTIRRLKVGVIKGENPDQSYCNASCLRTIANHDMVQYNAKRTSNLCNIWMVSQQEIGRAGDRFTSWRGVLSAHLLAFAGLNGTGTLLYGDELGMQSCNDKTNTRFQWSQVDPIRGFCPASVAINESGLDCGTPERSAETDLTDYTCNRTDSSFYDVQQGTSLRVSILKQMKMLIDIASFRKPGKGRRPKKNYYALFGGKVQVLDNSKDNVTKDVIFSTLRQMHDFGDLLFIINLSDKRQIFHPWSYFVKPLNSANEVAMTYNDSGVVIWPVEGSIQRESLHLIKTLRNKRGSRFYEDREELISLHSIALEGEEAILIDLRKYRSPEGAESYTANGDLRPYIPALNPSTYWES